MSERAQLRLLDLRESGFAAHQVNDLVPRATVDVDVALESVRPLIADVASRGLDAVVDVTVARDGVDPRPLLVSAEELAAAVDALEPTLRAAIETAIERVRAVSEANLPLDTTVQLADGAVVSQRWLQLTLLVCMFLAARRCIRRAL